jgi:hypothetical protein
VRYIQRSPPSKMFPILISAIFSNVAFRINVLSAVESAAASAFLFLAICELIVSMTNKKPSLITLGVALFGSLLYSFSSIVWTYSLHAEVFPLNNVLCAALLFLTFKYLRTKKVTHAIWGAFVCGFALTNQQCAFTKSRFSPSDAHLERPHFSFLVRLLFLKL